MTKDQDSQQDNEVDEDASVTEANTIDEQQLEELLRTAGVTAADNPDGSVSVRVDLETIINTFQSQEHDAVMQNIMNDIARELSEALFANNIAMFLSMYLAMDKFLKVNPEINDPQDALQFFEENAARFRKEIAKGLNPDDSEEPETAEEATERESKFKIFVKDCNYCALNDLYRNHNATLIQAVRQLQRNDLEAVTDYLRSNTQLQTFLNLLEACFPEYATTTQTHEDVNPENLEFDADGYLLNQSTTSQAKVFEITDLLIEVLQEFFKLLVPQPPILHLAKTQSSSKKDEPDSTDSTPSTTHNVKRPRV